MDQKIIFSLMTIFTFFFSANSDATAIGKFFPKEYHGIDCVKDEFVCKNAYSKTLDRLYKYVKKDDGKNIEKICAHSNGDFLEEIACNLTLYLAKKDSMRFINSASALAKKSKVYFYVDDVFDVVRYNDKSFYNLYWEELENLAIIGYDKAFKVLALLARDNDGWVGEDLFVKFAGFYVKYPQIARAYWSIIKENKEMHVPKEFILYKLNEIKPKPANYDEIIKLADDLEKM